MPDYKQDPNDSKKLIPVEKSDNFYGRTIIPSRFKYYKAPDYVVFRKDFEDKIGFTFSTSHSFAALDQSSVDDISLYHYVVSGSENKLKAGSKLDIHPNAWSGSSGDRLSVVFVYRGGLDGIGKRTKY